MNNPSVTNHNLIFQPHPLVRNRHLQTIMSSIFKAKGKSLVAAAREVMLDGGAGVRLQGYYSPQPEGRSAGLVLLLHGWLGHAGSAYNLAAGEYLFRRGYSVFRLNFRDHGGTHHLNRGMFRGDLLDEVFEAAQRISELERDRPFHIVGSSLGGSFALRLAWRHTKTPISNLVHTVAINPPLNPYRTVLALDKGSPIYLAYFRQSWRTAFKQKQAAFPELYPDISALIGARTSMAMTEAFIPFTPHPTATAYLNSYAVSPAMMRNLQSPVTIITAADDPVVPVIDFYQLCDLSPQLRVVIQGCGGHVGFIDLFPFRAWICRAINTVLSGA